MADDVDSPGRRLRGKRVLVRSDLNVPLDGTTHHRRRPDPRQRADHPGAGRRRRPGGRDRAPGPARRARRTRRTPWRPVAARLGELLGADVAFATDTVGDERPARPSTGSATARSRCWRTSASTPGETSKDDAERGAFADQLAALGRRVRLRRLRRRAPQAGHRCTTSRSGCRTRWAAWSRPRSTCCAGSPRTPSGPTSSCSAARRSPTSSASSTTCSARPTSC